VSTVSIFTAPEQFQPNTEITESIECTKVKAEPVFLTVPQYGISSICKDFFVANKQINGRLLPNT
jgi:hypothetical protein